MFQPIDRVAKFVKDMMCCVFQPVYRVAKFVKDMMYCVFQLIDRVAELVKDMMCVSAHRQRGRVCREHDVCFSP